MRPLQYEQRCSKLIKLSTMNEHYLTAGDLALYEQRKGHIYDGYYPHQRSALQGASIAGVALGGAAFVGALVIGWGVNQASKARSRGAENLIAANAKTMEMLAGVVNREANRNDTINLDVSQTLRNFAGGGTATSNAISRAEALAILQGNNGGVNSAIGGCNYLRVARVSGSRLCGCDNCEG